MSFLYTFLHTMFSSPNIGFVWLGWFMLRYASLIWGATGAIRPFSASLLQGKTRRSSISGSLSVCVNVGGVPLSDVLGSSVQHGTARMKTTWRIVHFSTILGTSWECKDKKQRGFQHSDQMEFPFIPRKTEAVLHRSGSGKEWKCNRSGNSNNSSWGSFLAEKLIVVAALLKVVLVREVMMTKMYGGGSSSSSS